MEHINKNCKYYTEIIMSHEHEIYCPYCTKNQQDIGGYYNNCLNCPDFIKNGCNTCLNHEKQPYYIPNNNGNLIKKYVHICKEENNELNKLKYNCNKYIRDIRK